MASNTIVMVDNTYAIAEDTVRMANNYDWINVRSKGVELIFNCIEKRINEIKFGTYLTAGSVMGY